MLDSLPRDLMAAENALASGNYPRAAALYTRFLAEPASRRLPPQALASCYLNRGFALRRTGQLREALADFARASELNPTSFKPHLNAALILAQDLERYEEALVEFDHALRLNPTDTESLSSRGLTKMLLGDPEGAEADLRKALSIAPADPNALCNLGNLYLQRGQPQQAAELYQKALAANPRDSEIRMNLALALSRMGAVHAAESALRSDRKARKLWVEKGGPPPRRQTNWKAVLVVGGSILLLGIILGMWRAW